MVPQDLAGLILDRAHNAAVLMDEHGVVTYWNPSAERIFGYRREGAVGRRVVDLIVPEHLRAAHRAGLEWFLADGTGPVLDKRIEITALRADGGDCPSRSRFLPTVTAIAGSFTLSSRTSVSV